MPSVQLAAVMFCDAVQSTELLVRLGDQEFDVRRRTFEALVRHAVSGHRGRIVKNLGDGALATFGTPSDALAAGVTVQQAVAREMQRTPDSLAAHIGISAGEVTVDDDDVFGATVVEASRLCDAAGPGTVFVSAAAAALARNGPAPLRAIAPLALKGFPEPVAAFEVAWTEVVDPGTGDTGPELPAPLRTVPAIPFVARPDEWAQLTQGWEAVRDGGRHAVFVRGQPGAGKTRLVAEFARYVASNGGTVLFGACREGGGPPFGPVVDALEHLVAHADDIGIDDADAERARRLLQAEPDEESGPELTFGQDPRAARFQAATDLLADAGLRGPVLFVLDDLQWAGRPTLQLLLHWLRTAAPLRCCFVATHREARADASDAFDDALAEIHRLEGVTRVLVSGFDPDGVAAFVEAASGVPIGAIEPRIVDVLAAQTDGNPFLLGELWRHLVETGALRRDDTGWVAGPDLDAVTSPESVRSVVARRIDRLPGDARQFLEVAAVIGSAFSVDLLAETARIRAADALDQLEPAIASATVEALGPGSFRFTHALVWRAIYDRLTTARRATLHLEVAGAIERRVVDDRSLADLARHYAAAVPVADPATAVDVAERAAEVAMRAAAFEDAAEMLTNVLALAGSAERRAELLVPIAAAELRGGDGERALLHLREALDTAQDCDRGDLMVQAALGFEDASWRLGLPGDDAERMLRDVLPRATDEVTRIHVIGARGRALALSGDPEASEVIETAIAAARRHGDRTILRFTLGTFLNLLGNPETYAIMLDRAYELRVLCADSDDLGMVAHAQHWFVYSMLLNTQFEGLADAVAEHHRICERCRQPFERHLSAALRSTMALMEGRFADSERFAENAAEFAAGLSGVDVSGAYGVQMFSLRREQGRLEEMRPVVEAVARLERQHAAWRPALAAAYAELGMVEETRTELRSLVTPGLARVPRDSLYLAALTFLADAVAFVGDRFGATVVYAELERYRNTYVVVGHMIACYGSADRYLGALAETAGRARDAERHYVRAIELDSAAGAATWLAHSRFRYARFLVRQGRRDGPRRAQGLLEEVLDAARSIGMPALEQRATALAREIDTELDAESNDAAERERDLDAVGVNDLQAALTPREREILDCLVDGSSNAQIGRTLHISANTAANHVRAILLKTGCANRTEAASWAVRRGLVRR